MKPETASRILTGLDTKFLNLERKEIPLSIRLVCVFERAIPFQKFVKDIESKLHLLPRYRQIVVVPSSQIIFSARAWILPAATLN